MTRSWCYTILDARLRGHDGNEAIAVLEDKDCFTPFAMTP
jgi:hypothetical protein